MVRHHVKKKKTDAAKKKSHATKKDQEEKKRLEEELENLDRFAGSSDEEEGDGDGSDGDDAHDMMMGDGPADEGDSSDSEDEDSEDDYDDVYKEGMKGAKEGKTQTKKRPIKPKEDADADGSSDGGSEDEDDDGNDSENDYNDAEQSDDDDEMIQGGHRDAKSLGMANAMSRILAGSQSNVMFPPSEDGNKDATKPSSKEDSKPVILSKTTTPLQRLQQKIKTEERALRQKRQNRRAENLTAMRLPLAPTAGMSAEKLWKQKAKKKKNKNKRKRGDDDEDDKEEEEEDFGGNSDAVAVASEIEAERTHRRIATRGAVALFNAISKHRAAVAAEAAAKEEEKRRIREEGRLSAKKRGGGHDEEAGVSSKTKHGFLDMIKKSAAASATAGTTNGAGARSATDKENNTSLGKGKKAESKSIGWNALKDDFMMNSKLKDWDKEISDDDDSDGGQNYDEPEGSKAAVTPAASGTVGKKKSGRKRQKV